MSGGRPLHGSTIPPSGTVDYAGYQYGMLHHWMSGGLPGSIPDHIPSKPKKFGRFAKYWASYAIGSPNIVSWEPKWFHRAVDDSETMRLAEQVFVNFYK